MPSVRRGLWRFGYLTVAGVLIAAAWLLCWRVVTHNEEMVVPGQLYRSGQLTDSEMRDEIARDHIRSVINLRGANPRASWYRDELALCDQLRVRHFDVHLSALRLATPVEADRLLLDFQQAPRPILIHCSSGSNRTGFAAALFLIDEEHVPWQQAENALTVSFGHFALHPYFRSNEFVQLYGQSGDPSLRDWTERVYPSVYAGEMKESKLHEMLEPLELLVRGRLN